VLPHAWSGGTVAVVAHPAPADVAGDLRTTVDQYVDLSISGVLGPDHRVELLEGVVVAMSPQNPRHVDVLPPPRA
jgi:hypothetical protein